MCEEVEQSWNADLNIKWQNFPGQRRPQEFSDSTFCSKQGQLQDLIVQWGLKTSEDGAFLGMLLMLGCLHGKKCVFIPSLGFSQLTFSNTSSQELHGCFRSL